MGCSCRPISAEMSSWSELWAFYLPAGIVLAFSFSTDEANCSVEGCYAMISQNLWNLRIFPSRYVSFGELAKQLTPNFVIQVEL